MRNTGSSEKKDGTTAPTTPPEPQSADPLPSGPLALLSSAALAALSLLLPPHCSHCLSDTLPGAHLCKDCLAEAPKICAPFCQRCSQPFAGLIETPFRCPNCRSRRIHFTCAVSAYRNRGLVRECIHRFKYMRAFHLRHPLAHWLLEAFEDPRLQNPRPDFLIPVPLHPVRKRERQFNQAEEIAHLVAPALQTPVATALLRLRNTSTQTRLDRTARMENLRGAFAVRQDQQVRHQHLVLIDDVLTTGSTVDECARILRRAGARSVRVATVARA